MKIHAVFSVVAAAVLPGVVSFAADAGNVVFRDDFEGANESAWRAGSKRFSYVAGEGVNGSKALMWEGAQPVDKWETYGYTFPVECGRDYTYSVKARSAEDIVGRVYVRIACVMADGKRRAFTLNGMPIVNNGWKRRGFPLGRPA